ncbi:lysoplasmalogenase [Mycobacterium sp. shizuoka-1]|uniref:lysoplasmalogenase n=1 Tax=Mycobacterium sp. shizuoka-1 TaxID=2039281 RepID=UPI000C06284F|nr:lysoplasmalogenase [Mycobacterium sp. shizuoka-1]GAY18296.1 lysoplasmalogenase [Mycobacterium sp. shizuoka-1]
MASTGARSTLGISPPYLRTPTTWWLAGAAAAIGYGVFLAVAALRLPENAELTGLFWGQPAVKALMAVLLAVAARWHPVVRERRWLVAALLFSAGGDFFLAMPWWQPSFVLGLGSFLVAHLCYLGALLPLRGPTPARLVASAGVVVACLGLLVWFWPRLVTDGLTVPVTVYMAVLGAMVCAALVARLPTPWTALGAVCFAVSDGMIGIGRFILDSQALEVPIWWVYATSQVLITAGFFFGRTGEENVAGRR